MIYPPSFGTPPPLSRFPGRPGFSPLAIIDLEELEMLEAQCERGASLPDLLDLWSGSALADSSYKDYVVDKSGWRPDDRLSRMKGRVDEAFERVVELLGLKPD